jgi:2-polyprenyl-3-methyl-5-hydroxy-6-metoxy-1,4-benzoquinol methylase
MPLEEDIGRAYESYYTHDPATAPRSLARRLNEAVRDGYVQVRYGYSQGAGPRWYRLLSPAAFFHPGGPAELEASAMFLPNPGQGRKLLDVGCGSGSKLARMRELGWEVEGLDADPRAVEVARSKGLNVHLGELQDVQYPPDHFDAVHIHHVIEHVLDPIALIRECYRVLAPGGTLVALTPNSESWGHRHFGRDWRGLEPPRHLYIFSAASLGKAAAMAGLMQLKIGTTARGARWFSTNSRLLRDKREGRRSGPVGALIQPVVHQLWTRMLRLRRPEAADELLMVVLKNASAAGPPDS